MFDHDILITFVVHVLFELCDQAVADLFNLRIDLIG